MIDDQMMRDRKYLRKTSLERIKVYGYTAKKILKLNRCVLYKPEHL